MDKNSSFFERHKFKIIFSATLTIVAAISIAALVITTEPEKPYNESLYSNVLNPATLKQGNKLELLYSYPLNSGQGGKSGFFTIVTTDAQGSSFPNITFDVQDQNGKSIMGPKPVVGKTTRIDFKGIDDTTIINLYVLPATGTIQLSSLTINLHR